MAPTTPLPDPFRRRSFEWPSPPLTGAVALRPWHIDDAPALVEAWDDPDMMRFTGVPPDPGLAVAERFIGGVDERRRAGTHLDVVIADPTDLKSVWGEVGLKCPNPRQPVALIGWWTMPTARGRGVATEAVSLLVRWALDETFLEAIVAQIDLENEASQRVAANNGFIQHPKHPRSWQVARTGPIAGRFNSRP